MLFSRFVRPFTDQQHRRVDARSIIKSIGNFENLSFDRTLLRCPARYAARLSQAFTATDATLVEVEEIINIADIMTQNGKHCFTDGVGTISREMAVDILTELKSRGSKRHKKMKDSPALQIRFGGSKGMLSVDHKLKGNTICLRPSMTKFEAPESQKIEIASIFDRPRPYFLNRPLIMLLEGLEVPYETFEYFQEKAVDDVHLASQSLNKAAKLLEIHGLGSAYRLPSLMLNLHRLKLNHLPDTFYQDIIKYSVHDVLRSLKNKARIPIPGGWTLVGVADIHKFLKEGEIFACIKPVDSSKVIYLQGPILISRSPCIHPGDVQLAHAIGEPPRGSCFAFEALPNTVVFSVLGERPLPSCLGGGDLDGDIYNLIPLDTVPEFWPKKTHPPGEYTPAPRKLLDRPSTMADVAEFICDYINSDVRLSLLSAGPM